MPYEAFKNYLENQLARKYQNISEFDTPTVTYIMYANDIPVGYIGLRTKINEQSTKWDKYKLVDYDLIKNTLNSL